MERPFEFVGILEKVFHRAKLGNQFHRGFLPHSATTGDIVCLVAHQCEQVDNLRGVLQAISGKHLGNAANLKLAPFVSGSVHLDFVGYQLAEILVGGHHIGGKAALFGKSGESAYHIVGLIARHLDNGDVIGADNILDVWHREFNIFGSFVALSLVAFVSLVPECRTGRVETHCDVARILFLENLLQSVDKSENRRGVQAVGCKPRSAQQCVVGSKNQSVGIEKEQFFFFHKSYNWAGLQAAVNLTTNLHKKSHTVKFHPHKSKMRDSTLGAGWWKK